MDSAKGWRLVPCEMSDAMLSTWQSAFDAHLRKKHKARFSDKDLGSAEAAAWRAVLALAAAPVPADSAKDAGMVEAVAEEADKLIAELLNETPIVAMREVVIVAINRGIALSVPLIEAQVIERCAAKIRERRDAYASTKAPGWHEVVHECDQCLAAIRALSPAGDAGGGGK